MGTYDVNVYGRNTHMGASVNKLQIIVDVELQGCWEINLVVKNEFFVTLKT